MYLIAIQVGFMEIAVFTFSCMLLTGTIYFFRSTLISLKSIKEEQKKRIARIGSNYLRYQEEERAPKTTPRLFSKSKQQTAQPVREYTFDRPAENTVAGEETISSVKRSILLQKQQLDKLLQKVEAWQPVQAQPVKARDANLENKLEQLELLLEEKEEEIQKIRSQNSVAEMMATRLEQVQSDFEVMQNKLEELEKQAAGANQLAMDLDDAGEENKLLQREVAKKGEKLQELMNENTRLQQLLYETEDKLGEANTQRQQLLKKTKLLEALNTDFQIVSDSNSKMKNELRRIGELESMLNMMTQERDHLLRKRSL